MLAAKNVRMQRFIEIKSELRAVAHAERAFSIEFINLFSCATRRTVASAAGEAVPMAWRPPRGSDPSNMN